MNDEWLQRTLQTALAHHQANRLAEAEQLYRQILQRLPNDVNALHLLGLLEHTRGRLPHAIPLLARAAELAPQIGAFHAHLAAALYSAGRMEEAIAPLQRAIQRDPKDPVTHHQLGVIFGTSGRLEQAIPEFRAAIELRPDNAEYYYGLGSCYLEHGRFKDAHTFLSRSVELDPNRAESHTNLGAVYRAFGKFDLAIQHYRRGIELNPRNHDAHYNLGAAYYALAEVPEALAEFRVALALKPDFNIAHSSLCLVMHYEVPFDARRLFEEHVRWDERQAKPFRAAIAPHTNSRDPDRRLRIGYVSADFYQHSIGFFLEPILLNHDRAQFEVFCYSEEVHKDATTDRLKTESNQWRPIRNVPDDAVAKMIRQDEIDILVDLSGHTSNNRMAVFARKPAPVQLSYLGYPNTTGLGTMDYRLTDPVADPPGAADDLYVEKLIRLPRTAWCYRPPDAAPEVQEPPVLRNNFITFGSFNNLAKINAPLIARWSELLRSMPESRLIIKAPTLQHPGVQARLREAFASHGIDIARVQLVGFAKFPDHMALYHQIDIALDTFPYNGTTTTCEAMWMGVPVVTLAGDHHVSRVGLALMTYLSLTELVGRSNDEYLAIARALSSNPDRLRELRLTLRDRMRQSPLMDAPGFTKEFESALREMWRSWCAAHR